MAFTAINTPEERPTTESVGWKVFIEMLTPELEEAIQRARESYDFGGDVRIIINTPATQETIYVARPTPKPEPTPEEKIAALEARVAELEANQSVVTWTYADPGPISFSNHLGR